MQCRLYFYRRTISESRNLFNGKSGTRWGTRRVPIVCSSFLKKKIFIAFQQKRMEIFKPHSFNFEWVFSLSVNTYMYSIPDLIWILPKCCHINRYSCSYALKLRIQFFVLCYQLTIFDQGKYFIVKGCFFCVFFFF